MLVSWALPRGARPTRSENRLAVHTEDHPLEYLDFAGEIPKGEYGGGTMTIWDRGTYERGEVPRRRGDRRLPRRAHAGPLRAVPDPGQELDDPPHGPAGGPGREPMPERIKPMLARLGGSLPDDDEDWGFEIKWDGVRAIAYCEGGRVRLQGRNLTRLHRHLPGAARAGTRARLREGRPRRRGRRARRAGPAELRAAPAAHARRVRLRDPAPRCRTCRSTYVIFDLLYLDGHSTMSLPYTERRDLLERLELDGAAGARRPITRARARPCSRPARAGPGGSRGQAARLRLRARPAHARPGSRSRTSHARSS